MTIVRYSYESDALKELLGCLGGCGTSINIAEAILTLEKINLK